MASTKRALKSLSAQADGVLLLIGRQGIGKSSAFRELASARFFADTDLNLRDKDAYMMIARAWIYEVAELTSFTRARQEKVKAFISSRVDEFRPPYGRAVVSQPRTTLLVATTNDESPLVDSTGSRRFWTIAVTRADREWIAATRDQLFAEAVSAYRNGERWHLDQREHSVLCQASARFQAQDVWLAPVEDWCRSRGEFSAYQVLVNALEFDASRIKPIDQKRALEVFRSLGYQKANRRRYEDGVKRHLWRNPSPTAGTNRGLDVDDAIGDFEDLLLGGDQATHGWSGVVQEAANAGPERDVGGPQGGCLANGEVTDGLLARSDRMDNGGLPALRDGMSRSGPGPTAPDDSNPEPSDDLLD